MVRDSVRNHELCANEVNISRAELQGYNAFEHFNVENLLFLEQGWNHDAQIDTFGGKKHDDETKQLAWVIRTN